MLVLRLSPFGYEQLLLHWMRNFVNRNQSLSLSLNRSLSRSRSNVHVAAVAVAVPLAMTNKIIVKSHNYN